MDRSTAKLSLGIALIIVGLSGLFHFSTTINTLEIQNGTQFFNASTHEHQGAVINICMTQGSGGQEISSLTQHEEFCRAGIRSILVCPHHSPLYIACMEKKLPVMSCSRLSASFGNYVCAPGLKKALQSLAAALGDNILAIHCNNKREIFVAQKIARSLTIPVVLTQHTMKHFSQATRSAADGIVAVCRDAEVALKKLNTKEHVSTEVRLIPPFFDYKKFLSFEPTTDCKTFFKKQFNIKLKPCPLIVKVANLYSHVLHKNHPLLFEALDDLIHKRGIHVQIALAGSGPMLAEYKRLVHKLHLEGYVHFLGATNQIPALLYYANINILASSIEAFGIALVEGGLMKKPTIIANNTGAANWLIEDKKTGFLFENNSAQSLANTILYALQEKEEAQQYGNNLYEKVMQDFLPPQNAQKLLQFYEELRQKKRFS